MVQASERDNERIYSPCSKLRYLAVTHHSGLSRGYEFQKAGIQPLRGSAFT